MTRKKKGPLQVERWKQFKAWAEEEATLTAQNAALKLVEEQITPYLAEATSILRKELLAHFERLEVVLRAGVLRMDESARQSAGVKRIPRDAAKTRQILRADRDMPAEDLARQVNCSVGWVRTVRRTHGST